MMHRTYKGKSIDMNAFRAKNEKSVAVGNMGVNAKGEKVVNGKVVETSNKRVRQQVSVPTPTKEVGINTESDDEDVILDDKPQNTRTQSKKPRQTRKPESKKPQEKELDNGDIVIEDDSDKE